MPLSPSLLSERRFGERLRASFCMAPMAGVTDAPFRARLRRNGCRWLFTEMVSAAALARGNRKTLGFLRQGDVGSDLSLQLFGAEPAELREAALLAAEAGYGQLDFNMGCPVRKVVSAGAGAALLTDLARAARCIVALRGAFPGMLSVKIRAGWDGGRINCTEAAQRAADCGADLVTLHARTRAQGYSGVADWSLVRKLAAELSVPVVGNGDVADGRDAVDRLRQNGVAAVMVGRAAVAQPWLFRVADALLSGNTPPTTPGPVELGDDLLLQMEDLVAAKGERVAVYEMRKFLAWAARGLAGAAEFRRRIQGVCELGALRDEVRAFFTQGRWEAGGRDRHSVEGVTSDGGFSHADQAP